MIEAIQTSNTGLDASQSFIDVTSNNLANVSTTAFKANQVRFQDLFYQTLQPPGPNGRDGSNPTGVQLGRGVRLSSTNKTFGQGTLQNTGVQLDVGINGQGFFQITSPGGVTLYTRDGAFRTDPTGRLVTADGSILQPPIVIPPRTNSISIAADGTVSVFTADMPNTAQVVGHITLVRFANPPGLRAVGNNEFAATSASGSPVKGTPGSNGTGTLAQGFLEASNVDPNTELANLLIAQENFVANGNVIQVASAMLTDTVALVT